METRPALETCRSAHRLPTAARTPVFARLMPPPQPATSPEGPLLEKPAPEARPAPLYITGPTASGKSAFAALVARRLGGEVVNADAFQLYAGMPLLTAQPSAAELAQAPHHLYGVLPLEAACDAHQYATLARPVLAAIQARGRLPVVVGGSGLYIKALTHGLAPLPPADPALRARLATQALEEKVAQLLALDPAAAQNVPLANPRYVDRALEICLLTGQPQSALRQTFATPPPGLRGVFLSWGREALCARIDARTEAMFTAGVLEEARHLPPTGPTAEKTLGLRELRALLQGGTTQAEAIAAIQLATRQYAKRQTTWFRRETWLQTICLPPADGPESLFDSLLAALPCLTLPPRHPHS